MLSPHPVLDSLAAVLDSAEHVRIDSDRVVGAAESIDVSSLHIPDWKSPVCPTIDNPEILDFLLLGDRINFKFWDDEDPARRFTSEFKGVEYRGSYAMYASLMRAREEGVPILDMDYLSEISMRDVEGIFEGAPGSPRMPMLAERAAAMREVGGVLKEKFGGHFANLLEAAGYRAYDGGNGVVELLVSNFPGFDDASDLDGERVRFYKRAQLVTGTVHGCLRGTDLRNISGIEELTVFADYELPKVLRWMGVLRYSDELARKIDAGEVIEADSRMEIEIRASSIRAGKLLEEALRRRRPDVNVLHVDYYLWKTGRGMRDVRHHLTVTTDY